MCKQAANLGVCMVIVKRHATPHPPIPAPPKVNAHTPTTEARPPPPNKNPTCNNTQFVGSSLVIGWGGKCNFCAGEIGTRSSKNFTASFRLPRARGSSLSPEVRVYQAFNNQQLHSSWTEAMRAVSLGVVR